MGYKNSKDVPILKPEGTVLKWQEDVEIWEFLTDVEEKKKVAYLVHCGLQHEGVVSVKDHADRIWKANKAAWTADDATGTVKKFFDLLLKEVDELSEN